MESIPHQTAERRSSRAAIRANVLLAFGASVRLGVYADDLKKKSGGGK